LQQKEFESLDLWHPEKYSLPDWKPELMVEPLRNATAPCVDFSSTAASTGFPQKEALHAPATAGGYSLSDTLLIGVVGAMLGVAAVLLVGSFRQSALPQRAGH